jgi:hypothetical protein
VEHAEQHVLRPPAKRGCCEHCAGDSKRACAFNEDGTFNADNWRCGLFTRFAKVAAKLTGDEVETLVAETIRGTVVFAVRRVGQAQRIRAAWVVEANCGIREVHENDLLEALA